MRERQRRKGSRSEFLSEVHPAQDLGDLDETLQIFRDAMRASAERPDYFWKCQHNTIMASLRKPPASKSHSRPALFWAPATLALVLCLFFFVKNSKAPTPDLAAGSDEILLVDVERALSQDCPEALAPAGLLSDKRPGPSSTK
jgi:hypothetical protein